MPSDPTPLCRGLMIAISVMALASCAMPRPNPGIACPVLDGADVSRPASAGVSGTPPKLRSLEGWSRVDSGRLRDLREQIARNYEDRIRIERAAPLPSPPPPGVQPPPLLQVPSYDVLALSAGGQYGAYGSGFLKGWGDRADLFPGRAEIDMITGVSTGAVMASFAYLGSTADPAVRARYDAILEEQYTTLHDEDVYRERSLLELLWANSVRDTTPLRDRLTRLITDEVLDAIVPESQRSKRLLFIGAVNADSGSFEHFDLIALAGDRSANRRGCYVAAVLAAAAIPVAFEPVFINGHMYLDGGARHHTFFLEQVVAALPQPAKNLFGILHGDLNIGPKTTKNSLIGVASRASSIMTDQLMLDSAYFVDAEGRRLGYKSRWTAAVGANCPSDDNDDSFSPVEGLCLWNLGLARARDEADPWKELGQLIPH
jgi:hypothetical protein